MKIKAWFLASASAAVAVAAMAAAPLAAENVGYTYDARGRLVKVTRSGAATADYTFDKADNILTKAVSGGTAPPPPPPPPSNGIVPDPSYELPEVGTGYVYNPVVSGVTFASNSGIAGNGSAWGFVNAPDGDQVAFLQTLSSGQGSITHNVSGLTAGQNYFIRFFLAQRPGYDIQPVQVSANGSVLGTFTPSSSAFAQFTSPAFQATGTTANITFTGTSNSGLAGSGLDKVSVERSLQGIVPDASYELPEVGTGYVYNPTVSGVTFASNSGIAGNGSAWGFVNAPDGDQVAFLQTLSSGKGAITHSVSGLTAGQSYVIRFSLAQRAGYDLQPVQVSANGSVLGTFTPSSTAFAQFTSPAFQATGSTATITFTGTSNSGLAGSGLDAVSVGPP